MSIAINDTTGSTVSIPGDAFRQQVTLRIKGDDVWVNFNEKATVDEGVFIQEGDSARFFGERASAAVYMVTASGQAATAYLVNGYTNMEVIPGNPRESNGAIPVNIQDQTSEPVDSFFNKEISPFSLAAPTSVSTKDVLVYTFTAAPGHGIVLFDEILLLDVIADRVLQCIVVDVSGDVITIDRPIDHIYPITTLGRVVICEMAVAGSLADPQIYTFRAGTNPVDVTRLLLTGLDGSSMDYSSFLGMPELDNGLVLRIVNGFQKTIFNFKTNRDIVQFCYDVNLEGKAPSGQFGFSARITFAGQDKHGVAIRISGESALQWVVQDDLTPLISLASSAQGHRVTD